MQEQDDSSLLRAYAEHDSEDAFATLVARHVNKVYSVALRQTNNQHQAEEITQAVFVILARNARCLRKGVVLEGWLYQTARLTALTFIRGEIRRARREQETYMETILNPNEAELWRQIAPLLDTAIGALSETDRHAVVLRFFYGKSMKDIGAALGGSEGAATLRVYRALEKLREYFVKHGIRSTTALIAGAISTNSIQAAPAALAGAITPMALAKGAAASESTIALIKAASKLMAWTKARTAVVAGAAVLLAGGATVGGREIMAVFARANAGPDIIGPANPGAESGFANWYHVARGGGLVSIDHDSPATGLSDFKIGIAAADSSPISRADFRSETFLLKRAGAKRLPFAFSFAYKLTDRVKNGDNIGVHFRFFGKARTNFIGEKVYYVGSRTGDSEMTRYKTNQAPNFYAPSGAVFADIMVSANMNAPWTSGPAQFDDFSLSVVSPSPWKKIFGATGAAARALVYSGPQEGRSKDED